MTEHFLILKCYIQYIAKKFNPNKNCFYTVDACCKNAIEKFKNQTLKTLSEIGMSSERMQFTKKNTHLSTHKKNNLQMSLCHLFGI